MPGPVAILDFPFFTLEYRDGVFARLIPADAKDLGGGLFRQGGKTWALPEDAAALAEEIVKGRPLLSLLNRGPNPLIKKGPRLALDGERLMELNAVRSAVLAAGSVGAGPVTMELRRLSPETAGLPKAELLLEGLPHHRLYQNVIYEIIDQAVLREFVRSGLAGSSGGECYTLRGEDIPGFAENHGTLLFRFGDAKLKELLAEDSVFVNPKKLSLVLGAVQAKRRGAGSAWALPLLRYGERRYPAEEVSLRMDREYVLLEKQWVKREDLEAIGLLPLGFYAGGVPVEKIKLKPGELLRRGGERFAGLFSDMEANTELALERGSREEVFFSHLEFLRAWGISGGIAHNGHREQAAFLSSWLQRPGGAGVLALMEKRYYELYLPPFLPELKAGAVGLPGADRENRRTPVRIAFYEDLPLSPVDIRSGTDILVLVEPEEIADNEQIFSHLQNIKADLVLGIFSDVRELSHGPAAAKARNLFGIKEAELVPYLIRDTGQAMILPKFEFSPPQILRSPIGPHPALSDGPSGGVLAGLFKYVVTEKFAGLSGPSLYSELALFKTEGQPAPFVPLRLLKGSLDIERMAVEERAFFVHWRGEFRKGKIIKTGEGYIRMYARELCLFAGGENEASANFREMLRLWESYGEIFDDLNDYLPRWLVDFAFVYEIANNVIQLLMPLARNCNDPMLSDIYIHHRFIEQNNSINFSDIKPLIPKVLTKSVFFNQERSLAGQTRFSAQSHLLARDVESVVNAVDRYLRESFHIKLFEFFYPQVYDTEKREAFDNMERAGRSSYSIEGLRFSKHAPLTSFLEDIFLYTEYNFKLKNGLDLKGKTPPLGETWKRIADTALGLEDIVPSPPRPLAQRVWIAAAVAPLDRTESRTSLPPQSSAPPQIKLLDYRLEKIRGDSDAVRDLLKIEDDSQNTQANRAPPQPGTSVRNNGRKPTISSFLKKLSKTEREVLKLIADAGEKAGAAANIQAALEALARKNNTMPALLIDKINAVFLELLGDLLIDTVDERPLIQREYAEELKKLLGGGPTGQG
ncbi:hypothetical protein AGMMS50293_10890 [Spirochaetia bacterium]|nr:hypothetical protein AGMMS50293_10890 [Spirochaetia bacterium]